MQSSAARCHWSPRSRAGTAMLAALPKLKDSLEKMYPTVIKVRPPKRSNLQDFGSGFAAKQRTPWRICIMYHGPSCCLQFYCIRDCVVGILPSASQSGRLLVYAKPQRAFVCSQTVGQSVRYRVRRWSFGVLVENAIMFQRDLDCSVGHCVVD